MRTLVYYTCKFQKRLVFLKNSQNPLENTCNFIKKETTAQVLSLEFRENFKNAIFTEHHRATDFAIKNFLLERGQKYCIVSSFSSNLLRED